MAIAEGIAHEFELTVSDSPGASRVGKDRWNAAHVVADGAIAKAKLAADAQNFLVPAGAIIMWSGTIATIPAGWLLCNGINGTPDLRDKFIVGAKQDDTVAKSNITGELLQSGGANVHGHDLPDHTHKGEAAHQHELPIYIGTTTVRFKGGTANEYGSGTSATMGRKIDGDSLSEEKAHALTAANTPAEAGGALSGATSITNVSNIPTFYALAFIMKTA